MPSNNINIAPIFKHPDLQQQFDTEGFVKIQLLSTADIELLTKLFYEYHLTINDNSFGASTFMHDSLLKHKIRDSLYPIFLPYFEQLFTDYSYFGSSYLYKTPGSNSDLAPHQDWSIVDEKKFVAVNIWTPLINTNPANGTLYVVPKSHTRNIFCLRAPTIPFYFQQYMDTVIQCSVPMNANAGEAVILNQSLIHYSSPNLSDSIRLAITSGLKTKGAPMLFHFKNTNGEIERYEMPEDFLLGFEDFSKDIYTAPKNGKLTGVTNYNPPLITKSDFMNHFGTGKNTFWEKVRSLIDQVF
jgi:hypothetical protein